MFIVLGENRLKIIFKSHFVLLSPMNANRISRETRGEEEDIDAKLFSYLFEYEF